jgi:glycosyltransferase involved in cell wall biosynthesis
MAFRWIVSQIGARQHYGVPRGFFYKNELRLFYTDAWCRWGTSLFRHGTTSMRAFAGRCHPDIPNSKVVSFNFASRWDAFRYHSKRQTIEEVYREYLHVGRRFSGAVARHLGRQQLDPKQDVFFGFNTGCLETFNLLRDRGIVTICDQIDPARVEEQIVHEESLLWPGWEKTPGRIPEEYWDRMSAEWAAASMVLVNSDWTRQALVKQGVPIEKILIIPVPYEPEKTQIPARNNPQGTLTVLWIGTVNLRKGIQYLIEAARLLTNNPRIRIVVIGPVAISDKAVSEAPQNIQFLGRITRDRTEEWYRKSDVFVLPTLSDGFAVSQVEAMAQALPVIATPNCGAVVTHGIDGLIVPARDAPALAEAISTLDGDRKLLREMSYRALDKSAHFYLPRQSQLLEEAVINFRAGRPLDQTELRLLPPRQATSPFQKTPALPVEPIDVETLFSPDVKSNLRVAVIQDGARLHYAVPLALHNAGALRLMFSEWFLKHGPMERHFRSLMNRIGPPMLRGLTERRCDEIPPEQVRVNPVLIARQQLARRVFRTDEAYFEWSSRAVGDWVQRSGLEDANVLFGFIRNIDPTLCMESRSRGILTVADQIIAPAAIERKEFENQLARWPDWDLPGRRIDFSLVENVERNTWRQLDRITCASTYVQNGLIEQGVNPEKITVIPYPIEASRYRLSPRRGRAGPLLVSFVGAVGLRKGAPYFLEIARRLAGRNIKFAMIGTVQLSNRAVQLLKSDVELVGRLPRSQIAEWLDRSDIFLFPSTCEGSAGAVMEAMASGLPVVTTPNSGSLIRDGIDGFVREYNDIQGMADCIDRLAGDDELRFDMGMRGREYAQTINLNNYSRQLVDLMNSALRK